jgi:hypothetical protein
MDLRRPFTGEIDDGTGLKTLREDRRRVPVRRDDQPSQYSLQRDRFPCI